MSNNGGDLIIAIDAGGTMTDCVIVSDDGTFTVGKSLTDRENEPRSYVESVDDAAAYLGLNSRSVHERALVSLYTGTGILNTIITRTGSRVGLLVTRGFEHILTMEGCLTWLGEPQEHVLHQQLRRHTERLVDPDMIIGVSERVAGGSLFPTRSPESGEVVIPLNREEVISGAERLLDRGAEFIGILFLNCFVNPHHEQEAKRIVEEVIARRGANASVLISSDVAPVIKENNRAKSLLFQAYAAEKTRVQLRGIGEAATEDGYRGRMQTLLSYGGAVDVEYPRLYETVISGPIGGLTGAQMVGKTLGLRNVVTADMGGTSFDVGILVDNIIQVRRSADFAKHRLATAMASLDSIGAGAGSVVSVDEYKRVHLGPNSAGYKIGVCYDYPDLTITDINVALGYVDPDYFLGGKIKLNRERALEELEKCVAIPLGLDVYAAGAGVIDVVHHQMRDMLRTMLLSKGYNAANFTALCYGGAGPVHMWGYTKGLGLAGVITVPWAAGFSAYGAACAEYFHRYETSCTVLLPRGVSDEEKLEAGRQIEEAWRGLEKRALAELAATNVLADGIHFRYGVYARYMGQLESFDTPLDFGTMESAADVDRVVAAFENVYTEMYPVGARFPEGGYAVTEVYLHAVVPRHQPTLERHALAPRTPSASAHVGLRNVYHDGEWRNFDVWQMEGLKPGNVLQGPCVIQDPMTTVVTPPGYEIAFDEWRVMHHRPVSS